MKNFLTKHDAFLNRLGITSAICIFLFYFLTETLLATTIFTVITMLYSMPLWAREWDWTKKVIWRKTSLVMLIPIVGFLVLFIWFHSIMTDSGIPAFEPKRSIALYIFLVSLFISLFLGLEPYISKKYDRQKAANDLHSLLHEREQENLKAAKTDFQVIARQTRKIENLEKEIALYDKFYS